MVSFPNDGVIGEDVTPNARTIRSMPLRGELSEARGEVMMTRRSFEKLNAQRAAEGLSLLRQMGMPFRQ